MNWRDIANHAREEEKAFRKRATAQRKIWLECRKRRDWIGALTAKDREIEYRRSAADRKAAKDEAMQRAGT